MKQIKDQSDLIEDCYYLLKDKYGMFTLCIAYRVEDTPNSDLALYIVSYFNETVDDDPFSVYERLNSGYKVFEVDI